MLGRKIGIARSLGLGVVSLGAVAFAALPAHAEQPSHGHNSRQPRQPATNPTHPHAEHAPHKQPPTFATQLQDHPTHKEHPQLAPVNKPTVMVHIRSPHKQHQVAPVITVPRPQVPGKQHIIVHSSKIVNKAPIVLQQGSIWGHGPHSVKVNGGTVKCGE